MDTGRKGLNITAFIIGGVLGASAILAISPKSRKQISKDIKSKSEYYLKRVRESTNSLVRNSKTSAELMQKKAEDIMNIVQQYAIGKINKPVSLIENEIAGLKAAISAAKASYSLNPKIHESYLKVNAESMTNEFEDETLPKQIGMGKGRNRKNNSI